MPLIGLPPCGAVPSENISNLQRRAGHGPERYSISHRLVARSGEANLDGWRLPAQELETKVSGLVQSMLSAPDFAVRIVSQAQASEIGVMQSRLATLTETLRGTVDFDLVKRIDIEPGKIHVTIDDQRIAKAIEIAPDGIETDVLAGSFAFQLRKRGVESRLIIAGTPTGQDERLIRNIANAHRWFEQIKSGKTFAEISKTDVTSKRRIQQMIDLAFLAPDIIREILEGKQPLGFTSDWCLRHSLPSNWKQQRELIATL